MLSMKGNALTIGLAIGFLRSATSWHLHSRLQVSRVRHTSTTVRPVPTLSMKGNALTVGLGDGGSCDQSTGHNPGKHILTR